jgi:hypothetical protein
MISPVIVVISCPVACFLFNFVQFTIIIIIPGFHFTIIIIIPGFHFTIIIIIPGFQFTIIIIIPGFQFTIIIIIPGFQFTLIIIPGFQFTLIIIPGFQFTLIIIIPGFQFTIIIIPGFQFTLIIIIPEIIIIFIIILVDNENIFFDARLGTYMNTIFCFPQIYFSIILSFMAPVRWGPCLYSTACPHVADENVLQIRREPRTTYNGWYSSLSVGRVASNLSYQISLSRNFRIFQRGPSDQDFLPNSVRTL